MGPSADTVVLSSKTRKVCMDCEIVKSLGDFTKDKRNKDGRTNTCKACTYLYMIGWKRDNSFYAKKPTKILPASKVCKDCNTEKSADCFPRIGNSCIACQSEYGKRWRKANPDKVKAKNEAAKNRKRVVRPGATQICKVCLVEKFLTEFRVSPGTKLGVRGTCKECARSEAAKKYKANPEAARAKRAEWIENNPLLAGEISRKSYVKHKEKRLQERKEWRRKNLEKDRAREKRYLENNRPIVYAKNARRRAAETRATPPWLTSIQKAQIQEFYELAAARNAQTAEKHHVDHIVPLRSEAIMGLHVPWNLQILTEFENCRKHNKLLGYQ